jgi:hypothetical protein
MKESIVFEKKEGVVYVMPHGLEYLKYASVNFPELNNILDIFAKYVEDGEKDEILREKFKDLIDGIFRWNEGIAAPGEAQLFFILDKIATALSQQAEGTKEERAGKIILSIVAENKLRLLENPKEENNWEMEKNRFALLHLLSLSSLVAEKYLETLSEEQINYISRALELEIEAIKEDLESMKAGQITDAIEIERVQDGSYYTEVKAISMLSYTPRGARWVSHLETVKGIVEKFLNYK